MAGEISGFFMHCPLNDQFDIVERGSERKRMNKTIERTVQILEFIAKSREPVTMAEVRNALGLPKSSASDIFNSLLDLAILRLDDRGYATLTAGARFYDISAGFIAKNDLISVSNDVCVGLAKETGKLVCLSLFNDNEIVLLEKISGSDIVQPQLNGLPKFSLSQSASGKAILAASSRRQIRQLLPGAQEADLYSELMQVSRDGYAISHELPDLSTIAAPVLQSIGDPLAAICIIDFDFRLDSEEQRRLGEKIAAAALTASRQIGFKGQSLFQDPQVFRHN
ncbi:IclR family transcriptional regulator [Raoultella sp. BIGb0138]|uniref:IclR family transcriptional regulator n=1 Tax=Raoultella sp. BIGb0138 TaxID=2485115 RepID=UPI0010533D78|nr:IclR family transcriptional regulator C-terminal domain-containing protein [Raoultella sp. BIGb0138]TCW06500.1 IclR family transcriptional regulator [Raoultella sp. BIGb0138]